MARATGRGGIPLSELPDLETSEEEEEQQQDDVHLPAVPPPVQQLAVPPQPPQIDDPAVDLAVDPAVVPPVNRCRRNYTLQKGQTEGSLVLSFEGKIFHKDSNKPPKVYYKCRNRKECGARGYIFEERFHLNLDIPHRPR